MKLYKNVAFLNAGEIENFAVSKKKDVSVLMVMVKESKLDTIDVNDIEEKLYKMPYITVGVFEERIGEKAIEFASVLHMRIALENAELDANFYNTLKNSKREYLLNQKVKKDILNKKDMLEIGFISKTFENLESEEFAKWLKLLFLDKEKEQLLAIKKCYDWYKQVAKKTSNRSILAMEESKQFCLLASEKYKKVAK